MSVSSLSMVYYLKSNNLIKKKKLHYIIGTVLAYIFKSLKTSIIHPPISQRFLLTGIFIVGAKRTPFGTHGGKLTNTHITDLQTIAAKAALAAGNVDPKLVDSVNIGNVMPVIQIISWLYLLTYRTLKFDLFCLKQRCPIALTSDHFSL